MEAPDARRNLTIDKGAEFDLDLTWREGDGTAINLTDATATFKAFTRDAADTPVISKTQANAITLGGAAGTIVVHLAVADVTALTATDPDAPMFYELDVVKSGVTYRILSGDVKVVAAGEAAAKRRLLMDRAGVQLDMVVSPTRALLVFEVGAEPAAPPANGAIVFAVDSGAGKTILKALFASGAAQTIATQP